MKIDRKAILIASTVLNIALIGYIYQQPNPVKQLRQCNFDLLNCEKKQLQYVKIIDSLLRKQ